MTWYTLLIFAYVLGSVPVGLIVCRSVKGIDIRAHGSGNIGASNVGRAIGPVWGVATFLLDLAKGLTPVLLARLYSPHLLWLPVACGLLAIIGHNFSLFLEFRGGKGVATSLGVAFGLSWPAALIAFAVWGLVLLMTRYISVASLIATPLGAFLLFAFSHWNWAYGLFALLATVFVLVKHRTNLTRLRQGTEPKLARKES